MTTLAADLFDYAAAQALKQHGIALTNGAQPIDWTAGYAIHAERFLESKLPKQTFIGEDLRRYLEPRIGSPRSANAWGGASCGLFRRWLNEGRIREIGMAPMSANASRRRRSPLYEVVG